MEKIDYKELIINSIRYHFDGALDAVVKVGGAQGKAPPAIEKIKSSLVNAASSAEARVYGDYELSPKLLGAGVDLAYRKVVVSDVNREDEWVALLAVGLELLDEHSQKVVASWHNQTELQQSVGSLTPRRLLVFIQCAKKTVTMRPAFSIANETAEKAMVLSPCVFQWSIPQSDGQYAVVGHVELRQELLDDANRLLSVIDSSHSAKLFDDHVRSIGSKSMH